MQGMRYALPRDRVSFSGARLSQPSLCAEGTTTGPGPRGDVEQGEACTAIELVYFLHRVQSVGLRAPQRPASSLSAGAICRRG